LAVEQSVKICTLTPSFPEPDVRDVEYTSKMPLLGNSTYSVRNWFEKAADGITVRWKLLQSPMAEISDGSLRVEPMGSG
jgi:hypothetical protein